MHVLTLRNGVYGITSAWQGSIRQATSGQPASMGAGGLLGLLVISVMASFVSNIVTEALGRFLLGLTLTFALIFIFLLDLGSPDDNLMLPIISGMYTGVPQASWDRGFMADIVINLFHFGPHSLGLASCIYPSTLYVAHGAPRGHS